MVQGSRSWKIPPAAKEVIDSLRMQGVRFNIINKVDYRIELHYVYSRLDGKQRVHFVAELDTYGNVTEWGPYMQDHRKRAQELDKRDYVLNADGERFKV